MNNDVQQNQFYPLHASRRFDELRLELDEAQQSQLYNALGTMSHGEWLDWSEANRAEISQYDCLTKTERAHRLLHSNSVSSKALLLHYACIQTELWRVRLAERYFHLPPSGAPLDTHQQHREMLMAVAASYWDFDLRDLWPFDFPEASQENPFQQN
jgi:hypothetical protein